MNTIFIGFSVVPPQRLMFISGGENVHPETIKQAICEHPTGGLKPSRAALKSLAQELIYGSAQ
ncbi:MAG: hypothetical protein H9535_10645 [Ignavibacteria bacterium]|nr:hypothetical protein [Ignavibacteria bacterium]